MSYSYTYYRDYSDGYYSKEYQSYSYGYYDYDYNGGEGSAVVGVFILLIYITIGLCCTIGPFVALCYAVKVNNRNKREKDEIKKNKRKMKDFLRRIDANYKTPKELRQCPAPAQPAFIMMPQPPMQPPMYPQQQMYP